MVAGLIYGATLYPGVGGRLNAGDSAKFQFIGTILGVPHEPGYPQYVVLNHLWTRLPFPGDIATRVNALSAVLALLAGTLTYVTAWRLSRSSIGAALGAWGFLLAPTMWTLATEAEVYTLHLFWTALFVWALCTWARRRARAFLLLATAATALSFGNHLTTVAFLPPLFVAAWRGLRGPIERLRWAAWAVALALLGASQYLFVWFRAEHAAYAEAVPRSLPMVAMFERLAGGRFTDRFFLRSGIPGLLFDRAGDLAEFLLAELGLIACGLAVVGTLRLVRTNRSVMTSLVLTFGSFAFLFAAYETPDSSVNALPLLEIVTLLASVGVVSFEAPKRWIAAAAWAFSIAISVQAHLPAMVVQDNPFDRSEILRAAPPRAIVVTHRLEGEDGYDDAMVDLYYTFAEPRVRAQGLDLVSYPQFVTRHMFLADRPVVTTPELAEEFRRIAVPVKIRSTRGNVRQFLLGQAPTTFAAVLAAGPVAPPVLRELHEAVAAAGAWRSAATLGATDAPPGDAVVEPGSYVAILIEGRGFREALRYDDASLELRRGESLGAAQAVDDVRLFAGSDAAGRVVSLSFGGYSALHRDSMVHVHLRPPGSVWQHQEALPVQGLPLAPAYGVRTYFRAQGLYFAAGRHAPVLRDRQGRAVSADSALIESVVVDTDKARVRGALRWRLDRGRDGLDGLGQFISSVPRDDVVVLLFPYEVPDQLHAELSARFRECERRGEPLPWEGSVLLLTAGSRACTNVPPPASGTPVEWSSVAPMPSAIRRP